MKALDPFERSRLNTLGDIFDKDPEHQWHIDLLRKSGLSHPEKDEKLGEHVSSRMLMRHWPRDPEGKNMGDNDEYGYTTPNSTHLWGATLLDFFYYNRFPAAPTFVGVSTGSRLCAWMKAHGEKLDYAKAEIEWAKMENKPKLRPAADIMEIINARDLLTMMGCCGIPLHDEDDSVEREEKSDVGQEQVQESPVLPFDYKNYPHPWPLMPFSSKAPSLQSQIPLHLLPETLIVHDPFGLLHARPAHNYDDWNSVEDITHKYHLDLTSDSAKKTIAMERAKIAEAAASSEPVVVGILSQLSVNGQPTSWKASGSESKPGNAYRMTVPPPPPPPSSIAEAHLFISPVAKAGEGNHSYVYHAEWDLPRSVFSKPKICIKCVEEVARDIITRKNTKADPENMDNEPTCSPVDRNDVAVDSPSNGDLESCWKSILQKTPQREDGDVIMEDCNSEASLGKFILRENLLRGLSINLTGGNSDATSKSSFHYRVTDDTPLLYVEYTGPMSTVHVDTVPWYDPASTAPCPCRHLMAELLSGPLPGPTPPTAQVSVIAKLSIQGDRHLKAEAVNYQQFGAKFSEHWTGYTLAQPLQNPTPAGAIMPNFYGYYSNESSDPVGSSRNYYSPILLLEACGTPIEPTELSFDDKQECAALLLRMHHHGWIHGSFFPRNILTQRGDHEDFPLMKSPNDKKFRLIDFSRSKSLKNAVEADSHWSGDQHQKEWKKDQRNEKREISGILYFPDFLD